MRRTIVLLASASSILALGTAASLAAPVTNWTGFYVGVQGGGTVQQTTGNYDAGYSSPPVSPNYWSLVGFGTTGGLFAGYDQQISDMFVLGLEGEVDSNNSTIWYDTEKYAVQGWDASLKARFGMPLGNSTLLYALAGVSVSSFDGTGYWGTSGTYGNPVFRDFGAQIGIGVQTQLTDTIFARVEVAGTIYQANHMSYLGGPYWVENPSTFTIKAGLGAKFGGPAAANTDPAPGVQNASFEGAYVGAEAGLTDLMSIENYDPSYSSQYDPLYWAPAGFGGSGGLFAGYNKQLNDMFVLGLEGEVEYGNAASYYGGSSDYTNVAQTWSAALKAKFGMPFGNTLLYGLAGVSVSQFDYSKSYWATESSYLWDEGAVFDAVGGQIGLGVEQKLNDNVFGRLEVAGTLYNTHALSASGTPIWDVQPATLTVKAGIGVNFP